MAIATARVLVCSSRRAVAERRMQFGHAKIAATEKQDSGNNAENGQQAAQADNFQDRGAIARALGIVLKTEKQKMIDGRADFAGGSVDQAKTHIARGVLHAVKIARDAPVRSEQHDTAGMRENIAVRVKRIAKVGGPGQRVDGFFRTGQEMPAGGGVAPA